MYQVSKCRIEDDGDQNLKMYGGGGRVTRDRTGWQSSQVSLGVACLRRSLVFSSSALPELWAVAAVNSVSSSQVQTFWWVPPTIDACHWLPDCRPLRGRKVPHWALQVHLPRRRRSHLIAFAPPCYLSVSSTSINRSSTLDCLLFAFPAVYMFSKTTTPDRISCIPHGQAVHSHRR